MRRMPGNTRRSMLKLGEGRVRYANVLVSRSAIRRIHSEGRIRYANVQVSCVALVS
jgi:hypothetical protein